MKMKKGFTLAEVLVTLGIIGVVAAITLPSLLADTASAQIGPKLGKSVSMFEQANEALLTADSADSLSDTGVLDENVSTYLNELRKHLKGSAAGDTFKAKDGVSYTFEVTDAIPDNVTDPPHLQKIGYVDIDINGVDTNPNQPGTDVFTFSWWNDGSLRPKGGTDWDPDEDTTHWSTVCKVDAVPTEPEYCAGHIFENNFKVLYR